jgi:small-conductance mechanosensitive channel
MKNYFSILPVRCLMFVLFLAIAPYTQAQDMQTSGFSERTAINQGLQHVQSELQQHSADIDSQTYQLLKQLETTMYHHQAAIDYLAVKERQRDKMEEVARAWKGFDQPPPYSILFSDELRTKMMSLQNLQSATESRIQLFKQMVQKTVDQLSAFERTERQLTETAELEENAESRQTILNALQQNDISARTEIERVTYLELRQRGVQAELATIKTQQSLIRLQLKSMAGKTIFNRSEFDKILGRISDERKQVFKILGTLTGESQVDNVRTAWFAEFLDLEQRFWTVRFNALSPKSQKNGEPPLDTYRAMSQIVGIWVETGETMVDESLSDTQESVEDQETRDEFQRIIRLRNHIDFAISELNIDTHPGISLLKRVTEGALAVWGTELYLVEDTTSFEGKRVTSFRAITLGKLIQLVFILTAGWFALKFLSNRVRRLVSRRPGTSLRTANSISRWTLAIGLTLLTIYTLKLVRIPFTAFAFLGGTLAIGIGFGAQTLLKNFMSGVILILERPFKVGDFIEVDNVTGQIKRIGMRVSVIEHFDGIETLVPNSFLLDNRVDNWTFGKTAIRGSVEVGVAYGCSTREVSRTLMNVANAHGQVLDRPEPEVRFQSFGDSSQLFRLLFWVDPIATQRERLASDLRFMISKGLSEAGITISFPQRDIHFDAEQPLQVEVSLPTGSAILESDKK